MQYVIKDGLYFNTERRWGICWIFVSVGKPFQICGPFQQQKVLIDVD